MRERKIWLILSQKKLPREFCDNVLLEMLSIFRMTSVVTNWLKGTSINAMMAEKRKRAPEPVRIVSLHYAIGVAVADTHSEILLVLSLFNLQRKTVYVLVKKIVLNTTQPVVSKILTMPNNAILFLMMNKTHLCTIVATTLVFLKVLLRIRKTSFGSTS